MPLQGSLPGTPNPGDIAKKTLVDRERKHNMYFSAVGFINDVKTGPFWEHSPMLFDISGVPAGWGKINKVCPFILWGRWNPNPFLGHDKNVQCRSTIKISSKSRAIFIFGLCLISSFRLFSTFHLAPYLAGIKTHLLPKSLQQFTWRISRLTNRILLVPQQLNRYRTRLRPHGPQGELRGQIRAVGCHL